MTKYRQSMIGSGLYSDVESSFYNKDLSNTNSIEPAGIFKLFRKSFGAICSDLDFDNFLGEEFNYPDNGVITNLEEVVKDNNDLKHQVKFWQELYLKAINPK